MDTFIFERDDGTLLECVGERIARISTEQPAGPGAQRWHHLQIIRTDDGSYVLAIQYISRRPGEHPKGYAWRGTPSGLASTIRAFSPAQDVVMPANAPDDATAVRDRQELEERFDRARGKILRHFE